MYYPSLLSQFTIFLVILFLQHNLSVFGECPLRLSFHLPIFTQTQFHYIPWDNNHNNSTFIFHYQSLNFTPPLHFDNTTLQSLDHTFQLLDGKFVTQLTTLRRQISRLHPPHDIDSSAVIEQSPVVPPSCSKCCKPISFANTEPATV